ncbi:hypothetical protein GWO43_19850 [candidate division KSB1 bacterium]|nr:hypothetical protein [candidate division KSB1 bacterium]NIR71505.1 hypothetical protein [candidate division KSB1 bacterium]NIT73088.1 hypothetical protein [candidate division KSB1 bacterium]NIU26997.1 hypothetical protein [candidate division KSB1 bacterium]NIU92645.1 hypothetical protein [candidate division KSB1 bacterium]
MRRQLCKTTALLVIILFSLTACQKDEPVGITPELPPDFSDDLSPAWSPDGSTIAFTHRRISTDTCCGPFGIYFVNPDGSGRRLFLAGGHSPAWSPDGEKLAFVLSGSIAIMNKDSIGFRSFGVEGFFPAWSPDGTKIAYDTGEGGRTFIIDLAQEAAPEKFLDRAADPTWSPDGQELAFSRRETPFSALSIYKAKLDGSGISQLTKPREELNNHRYPEYSHKGNRIAFSSDNVGIIVIDAKGRHERVIIRGGASPSWSPDDQFLVFHGATDTPGRARLFIIGADGTGLRQLTL